MTADISDNLYYLRGLDDAINIIGQRMREVGAKFRTTPMYRIRTWQALAGVHTELYNIGHDLHVQWMNNQNTPSTQARDKLISDFWADQADKELTPMTPDIRNNMAYRNGLDDAIRRISGRMDKIRYEMHGISDLAAATTKYLKFRTLAAQHTALSNLAQELHKIWLASYKADLDRRTVV